MEAGVPNRMRIGPALVAEGVINEEQLQEALFRQHRFPFFTLGQIISILHSVPISIIDEVNLRRIVMPLLPAELLRCLVRLNEQDRFAKSLDLKHFITRLRATPLHHQTLNIDAREYADKSGRWQNVAARRYVVTQVRARVDLTIEMGDLVRASVNAEHDTRGGLLTITDDDDRLRNEFYYPLRGYHLKYARTS